MRALARMLIVLVLLGSSSGCMFIRAGSMSKVQTVSDKKHVGNVYLVRGLIGVFSFGMDGLADKLTAADVRSNVYQDDQSGRLAKELVEKYRGARGREPLVLVGHSLGADDVLNIAHELDEANIPVDLLVTVDAVNPRKVSKNVRVAMNYYKPHALDGIPVLRGIPIEAESKSTQLYNLDLTDNGKALMVSGTNHFNIDKNPKVQNDIVQQVLKVCQPRQMWVRAQGGASQQAAVRSAGVPQQAALGSAQLASDRSGPAPAPQASATPVQNPNRPPRRN